MWLLLLALGAGVASAAEVVLFAGVPRNVAELRAQAITGASADDLRVTTVTQLATGRAPLVSGDARIEVCTAVPTDPSVMERLVKTAETRLLYLDYAGVASVLKEARAARLCLRTAEDPRLAGRAHFLAGVAAFDQGDLATAAAEFRRAHDFSPGTAWDPDFPPQARALYETQGMLAAAAVPVTLRIVPFASDAELRIDGRVEPVRGGRRLVEAPIAPGEHLVQLLGPDATSTVRVTMTGPSATLVLPEQLDDGAALWASDPSRSPQLDAALSAFVEPAEAVTVVLPEETWRREPGRGWYRAARHAPLLTRRSPTNAIVAGSGAALLLGGAALGVASWIEGSTAASRAGEAATWTEYTTQQRTYAHARTRLYVGEGLAALGGAAFTLGLTIPLGPAPTRPALTVGVGR